MSEEIQEPIIDLLIRKATIGLDSEELRQLDQLVAEAGVKEDNGFELTAAAISLVDIDLIEPMPAHLNARIAASAEEYFAAIPASTNVTAPLVDEERSQAHEIQEYFTLEPRRRSWNWLGWAVAAAACIALTVNVWITQVNAPVAVITSPTPAASPAKLTPGQEMASMIASQTNITRASWGAGKMKDLKDVGGEVVWSDEKQKGFMLLRGLPVNDSSKQTYQLWIVDKTRDAKHPVDGGVFDVPANGEVVIPINAKLRALKPEMFVITVEQPGGVVVSDQGKVAAIAKVETKS